MSKIIKEVEKPGFLVIKNKNTRRKNKMEPLKPTHNYGPYDSERNEMRRGKRCNICGKKIYVKQYRNTILGFHTIVCGVCHNK
jgi:hypothetical protein